MTAVLSVGGSLGRVCMPQAQWGGALPALHILEFGYVWGIHRSFILCFTQQSPIQGTLVLIFQHELVSQGFLLCVMLLHTGM